MISKEGEEIRITKIEGPRKSITLPNEAISEIILGYQMLTENKDAIYKIAKKKFSYAKIYEAKASLEEFKLDFLPIF